MMIVLFVNTIQIFQIVLQLNFDSTKLKDSTIVLIVYALLVGNC